MHPLWISFLIKGFSKCCKRRVYRIVIASVGKVALIGLLVPHDFD